MLFIRNNRSVLTGWSADPSFVKRTPITILLNPGPAIHGKPEANCYQSPPSGHSHRDLLLEVSLASKKFIVLPPKRFGADRSGHTGNTCYQNILVLSDSLYRPEAQVP